MLGVDTEMEILFYKSSANDPLGSRESRVVVRAEFMEFVEIND